MRFSTGQSGKSYLLRVEVLGTIGVLLELLTAPVSEELVVGNLDFERTRVPLVVELSIIGVDEGEFLIYANM